MWNPPSPLSVTRNRSTCIRLRMTTIFAPIRMIEDQVAALVARNGILADDPVRSGRTDPVGGDPKEQDAIAHAGAGGGLSRSIRRRMSANRSRGMTTSAIWNVT